MEREYGGSDGFGRAVEWIFLAHAWEKEVGGAMDCRRGIRLWMRKGCVGLVRFLARWVDGCWGCFVVQCKVDDVWSGTGITHPINNSSCQPCESLLIYPSFHSWEKDQPLLNQHTLLEFQRQRLRAASLPSTMYEGNHSRFEVLEYSCSGYHSHFSS